MWGGGQCTMKLLGGMLKASYESHGRGRGGWDAWESIAHGQEYLEM